MTSLRNILLIVLAIAFSATEAQAQAVRFDADFESGALGTVRQMRSPRRRGGTTHLYYYVGPSLDPLNPIDTDLRPSSNWFYFRISGVKDKYLHLSMPDNVAFGASYSYDGNEWFHFTPKESQRHNIDKRFNNDTVYVAIYKPYTYSYLQERLKDWTSRPGVEMDTIGYSHEGRPLQLLHITDTSVPDEGKVRIWMHGRVHPSETPASYLLDGLVEYLTSDTPQGQSLRSQIDAWILPFINPDGVVDGLSRSNALGVNEEINFGRSEDSTVVEVRAVKAVFEKLTSDRPLDFMLNSHSQLDESAAFWMHRGTSTSPVYLRKEWTFAGLVCSMNPCMQPREMQFSNVASRYAEGWIWDRFADSTVALTIETPYTCYSMDWSGLWTTDDNLREFGKRTLQAVAEYMGLSLPGRYLVEPEEAVGLGWRHYQGTERSFIGDGAWMATRDGMTITYSLDKLPAGSYKLYRFAAGDCIEPADQSDLLTPKGWMDPGPHGWVYMEDIDQPHDGPFTYRYTVPSAGEFADALLLVEAE